MKESFYNIKFQHNGLNFIYNTKNSKLITFDNYDNLFANHYSDLVSNGFLVADDFNEFEEVVNKRSEYLSKEKDYKRFTILPTTKCNANCSFCYENDSPRYDMSDEVVEQTINFIKQESQEKKKIRVYWFGGEPLVRRDIIDKISKSLIEFSNENGINYQASIATNLSLLDKDDIEYAIENWHLNKIEFAFDGNKEQHNKSKDYKIKNFDAFQHNLDMIDCLLNKNIIVQIRFNITRENFNDAMLLVQEILKKHHGNKNLLLYLGVVFKTPKNQNLTKEELIEMRQIGNYSIEFFKLLKKYNHIQGVNGLPLTYKKNNCYASNDDSLVIGPAGIITKCQMCPDDELNKIGDIYSGIDFSSKNYIIWCNTLYFDKCQKCKLYPMCLSGCIGQKYIYNENTCCKEKFYLDELLKTAVDMLDEDKQLIKKQSIIFKKVKNMKNTTIGMNFCWNPHNSNALEKYVDYIDWCDKHKIKIIRIIFSKWGLNCIYNKKDVITLKHIVHYASTKNINIIISLLNFTDFNKINYLDINDKNFSWNFNKYQPIDKKVSSFFKKINNVLVEDINYVLDSIIEYNNIKFIEIMNEIDQVNCNDNVLINWCNKLINILSKKYQKYIFTCSISNYQKYDLYREKLNCYVDLHFYSFPSESAFENLQYAMKAYKEILYFGEYAKNSDYSYIDDYGSKLYFTSGLWGSYFLKLTYSAMSWWWDDIIINSDYERIIDFYNKNNLNFQFDGFEEMSTEELSIEYNNNSTDKHTHEINKIIERIINLLKHPLFIFNELKNIRKFLSRKLKKEKSLKVYKIWSKSKKIFYIECNEECIIDLKNLLLNKRFYVYDLIKCTKKIVNIREKSKINVYGCYILEEK